MIKSNFSFNFFQNNNHIEHCNGDESSSEKGFVTIVIVLLMLVLVTVVGISSLNMTVTETMIVRSDAQYKRNFYFAESAGYEAGQRLENTPMTVSNPTGGVSWVVANTVDMTTRSNWISDNGTPTDFTDDTWTVNSTTSDSFYTADPATNPSNLEVVMPGSYTNDDIRLSSQFNGVAAGSSLDITGAAGRLYVFAVYGMYSGVAQNEGEVLIQMGYRKRF